MPVRAKAKGSRAETEFVSLLNNAGIPSLKVIGSGAFQGADSDIKVGLILDDHQRKELVEDGKFPAKDECRSFTRAEIKNRATNPEWLYDGIKGELNEVATLRLLSRQCPEYLFDYLEQDAASSFVALKRNKTPSGALANNDLDSAWMVCMGLNTLIKLLHSAWPDIVVEELIAQANVVKAEKKSTKKATVKATSKPKLPTKQDQSRKPTLLASKFTTVTLPPRRRL